MTPSFDFSALDDRPPSQPPSQATVDMVAIAPSTAIR
jgi:hypothetical protein